MHIFITGTSTGIGRALALHGLEKGNKVLGLSRTQSITHKNYTHQSIDLSASKAVLEFKFPEVSSPKIVLVNNAGTLGDIKYIGNISNASIYNSFCLNLMAPAVLMNQLLRQFPDRELIIINVSSGAGKHPYDGWAEYCSSKAALDMFSRVLEKEIKQKKRPNVRVFAVSPGIVETHMQSQIRNSKFENFSLRMKFEEYYKKGVNKTPERAASELYNIIQHPEKFKDLFQDFWQA